MDIALSLAILLPPILVLILAAFLSRDRSQPRPQHVRWEAVAPSLQALGATDTGRRRMVLSHRGVEWTLHLIRGEGIDHLTFQRSLPLAASGLPAHPGVRLVREGPLHRLYKRLVPDSELQLGTADFDRAVFLARVTDAEATRQWLGQPEAQRAALHLFSTAGEKVGTGMRLLPWWPAVPFGATFPMHPSWTTPDGFAATLDALHTLSDALPPAVAPPPPESAAGVRIHLLLGAWLLATSFVHIELHQHWWPLVDGLWKVGVGLFVPLYGIAGLAALFLARQGIVRLHGACAILLYGWIAQALAAGAVATTYNGHGDPTEQTYTVTVDELYTTEGESGTLYKMRLSALPGFPDTPHTKTLAKHRFTQAAEGDSCEVRAGQGKLAIPWRRLESCSFFNAEDDD